MATMTQNDTMTVRKYEFGRNDVITPLLRRETTFACFIFVVRLHKQQSTHPASFLQITHPKYASRCFAIVSRCTTMKDGEKEARSGPKEIQPRLSQTHPYPGSIATERI